MGSSTITLYHYTSKEGKEGIVESEIIKSSKGEGGHAHFGDGVYFTDMSTQDFTRTEVSTNNYQYPNAKKKLEYCIIVTMPKDKVKKCKPKRNRRVFLHKGDVNLNDEDYYYKIEKSRFEEDQTTQNASVFQQGGATAMPNDIDAGASPYQLHYWLSSFEIFNQLPPS